MPRVLCVEDEVAFREDIADYLRLQAFEVDEADNGADALDKLAHRHYDAIISDINMPQMDGIELLKRVPRDAMAPPFLFLTALGDAEHTMQGMNLGADDVLAKPVNFGVLLAALKKRIGAQQSIRNLLSDVDELQAPLLAEAIREALAQPLVQVSEAVSFIATLDDSATVGRVKPLLRHVQDSAQSHLYQLQMMHEFLLMPHVLPESARPLCIGDEFLRYAAMAAFGEDYNDRVIIHDSGVTAEVLVEPDMLVASLAQIMVSARHTQYLHLAADSHQLMITISDKELCLHCDKTADHPLGEIMASARERAALSARLLALLHAKSLMQMHGGSLRMRCRDSATLSVLLSLPLHRDAATASVQ